MEGEIQVFATQLSWFPRSFWPWPVKITGQTSLLSFEEFQRNRVARLCLREMIRLHRQYFELVQRIPLLTSASLA